MVYSLAVNHASNIHLAFLTELLHAAGIKATGPRVRVLACLADAELAMSHAEFEQKLGQIDRVTLYRVLDTLVDHGLAVREFDTRGVARYLSRARQLVHAEHGHFHCRRCGRSHCLASVALPKQVLPPGFKAEQTRFDIEGLCASCNEVAPCA